MTTGFTCNFNGEQPDIIYNDLYLDSSGNIATNGGNEEIVENCYHALELWLSEYQFNTLLGINWRLYLSTNKPYGTQIKSSIINTIKSVNGVSRIVRFNMEIVNRQLIIETVILLNSGANATIVRSF